LYQPSYMKWRHKPVKDAADHHDMGL
jgi:hypothetical protein